MSSALPTVFGAELTLGITRPANGEPDPEGEHLLVLAEGPVGYARLARAISEAQMAGEKGAPRTTIDALAARGACAGAPAPAAERAQRQLVRAHRVPQGHGAGRAGARRPGAARDALDRLVAGFGRDRVLVELWDHGDPLDRHRNDALARVAMAAGVDVVATNNVHYATPAQRPLATALAAVRAAPLARRDRRLAPRRAVRAPAQRRRSRSGGSRAGRARSSAPSTSRARARSISGSRRPSCPTTTCPPVTPR